MARRWRSAHGWPASTVTSAIGVPSRACTGTVSQRGPASVLMRLRFCQPFFSYCTVSRNTNTSAAAHLAR